VSATTGRVGRYRLEAVIGTGAFSTVHRALDERLGDTVAIKLLADNHSLDPEVRERFLSEGRVLRRIDSAHVVRVHDLGETDRAQPYLVLEHADRGTLHARVTSLRVDGWQPTADDVRAVLSPLAAALEAVHGADVVHRDLSPRNVLLRSTLERSSGPATAVVAGDERLLVADLGLCKDLAVHSGVTVAGGTDGFRPPEQRGGPTMIASTADLWSVSALAVWLVTGDPPSATASCRSAIEAAGLPGALGDALDHGLAVDPADRPRDVSTWWAAVDASLPHPAGSSPSAPAASTSAAEAPAVAGARGEAGGPRAERRWYRHPALLPVATAVIGVLVGLSLAVFGGGPAVTVEDGEVRVERTSGRIVAAMVGPEELTVGEMTTFVAEGEGVGRWVWVDPSGGLHTSSALEITPSSPGRATIRLLAIGEDGTVVEVPHRLVVTEG
jgi:eukaryotic-like serine/threonine-protein kinase